MKISNINSGLTLEYVSSGQENLYLERKSLKVSLLVVKSDNGKNKGF